MARSAAQKRSVKATKPGYVLDEQIGFILRQVSQRHAVISAREIGINLTPTQWAALSKLALDPVPRDHRRARAEGHSRHKKQTGGVGQFGEVFLKVGPLPRGKGFEFVESVKGGVISNQFIPSVEKGVRSVLESGFVAGFPVQDVRVTVYDGKHHPVDSKDVAFASAGRKAFLDALAKARAIVLEPIVNVEIVAPDTNMGDIAGELSGHRGRIKGSDSPRPGTVQITAQAPLSELEHFPARLKSITAAHGSYSLEFSHYQVAPPLLGDGAEGSSTRCRVSSGSQRRRHRAPRTPSGGS